MEVGFTAFHSCLRHQRVLRPPPRRLSCPLIIRRHYPPLQRPPLSLWVSLSAVTHHVQLVIFLLLVPSVCDCLLFAQAVERPEEPPLPPHGPALLPQYFTMWRRSIRRRWRGGRGRTQTRLVRKRFQRRHLPYPRRPHFEVRL